MEEFNLAEIENQLLKIKSDAAIQSAKVARLIPSIARFLAHEDESAQLKRELIELEMEMMKEEEKDRKLRLGILDIKGCIWMVMFFFFMQICFELFEFVSRY